MTNSPEINLISLKNNKKTDWKLTFQLNLVKFLGKILLSQTFIHIFDILVVDAIWNAYDLPFTQPLNVNYVIDLHNIPHLSSIVAICMLDNLFDFFNYLL